ncbi:MAG: methylated-DNA--[protein]-cysteine S-methyltransferase [Terracoccus sp.]
MNDTHADRRLLDAVTQDVPGDPDLLDRLHGRLAAEARSAHLVDVSYRVLDSPVGRLLLAATPAGVVRVAFEAEGHEEVLETLARRIGPRVLRDPHGLDAAALELDAYFAGRLTTFTIPLDLQLAHGFRRGVLEHLRAIPYGGTESYGEVAAASGSPRAVRAVGSACATNPLPLIVPCHRVVRADGSLGGYLGGLPAKRLLLALEAAA